MSVYTDMLKQYEGSPYTAALNGLVAAPQPTGTDTTSQLLQLFDQYRQQLQTTVGMDPTRYSLGDYVAGQTENVVEGAQDTASSGVDVSTGDALLKNVLAKGEGAHGGPAGFTEGLAGQFGTPDYADMSERDLGIMQGALGFLGLGELAGIVGTGMSAAKGMQNGLPADVAFKNAITPGNHLNTGIGTSFGPAGMSDGGHGGNYAGGLADAQSADAQTNASGWAGFGLEQQAADNPDGWAGIAGEVEGAMGGSSGDGGYGESLGDFGGPDGGWI